MTEVTFPLWQLLSLAVTLTLAFGGFVFAIWRMTVQQRDRKAASAKEIALQAVKAAGENEKGLLRLRAELPLEYVRREDWVRNQTVIEAKLDALATKLDNHGGCHDR